MLSGLIDSGSTNRTFLNDFERPTPEHLAVRIGHRDRIHLGALDQDRNPIRLT
ncbi:MAG TPA: hypothetical protein VGH66_04975 [Acidimicrobiales bacterium]|jgi:hypothetical protein